MGPFRKLSVSARACLTAGLVLGAALVPVAAQSVTFTDGQVGVRSDGMVYLLTGGQKRQVATVQITDDELNAYPEGDPIYSGLAAIGSGGSTSASAPVAPAASPGTAASAPSSSSPSSGASSGPTAVPGATAVETPTGATGETDPALPIEVDIDGKPAFQAGERIILDIKTKAGANCQLAVKWPSGTEKDQDKKTADSRGRCHYSIEISSSESVGTGTLKGIVQDSANHTSRQNVDFDIITK